MEGILSVRCTSQSGKFRKYDESIAVDGLVLVIKSITIGFFYVFLFLHNQSRLCRRPGFWNTRQQALLLLQRWYPEAQLHRILQ